MPAGKRYWHYLAALLVGGAVAASAPSLAMAQTADQLYQQGLDAMLANDYATGCPALQKSYDLDPLPGALFTLAACYERWGKIASAVKRYEAFLVLDQKLQTLPSDKRAKAEDRIATAKTKVKELGPQVPTITVELSGVADAEVTIDDAPAAVGTSVHVDPGEHRIVAILPDGQRLERTATATLGGAETVTFEAKGPDTPPPDGNTPADDGGSERKWMLIGAAGAAGLGLAGVVVGAVTGGLVFAKKGDVEDQCVDKVCTPEGKEAADDAKTLGLVSTIGFVVGGIGIAAGAVVFFLAPDAEEGADSALSHIDVQAGPDGGILVYESRF